MRELSRNKSLAEHREKEINMTTNCSECGAVLELSADVMAHEIIDCSTCGVELEVMAIEPLTVSLAPDEEEDWGE